MTKHCGNELILVDKTDKCIGYGEKIETHKKGNLHRAFSVFIYDTLNKKLLIQKRELNKYHSGGLWTNSCCSHPYKGETITKSLKRCIFDELGIQAKIDLDKSVINDISFESIKEVGKFYYYSDYKIITEHEIDKVFIYYPNKKTIGDIAFNNEEISEILWIDIEKLNLWLNEKPDEFTSWFKPAYSIFLKNLLL